MLKSLEINNFQSHKKTILQFHKGVNVIMGPTDSGKSAILRSLDLVLNNGLSGISFIREGAKETKLVIDVDNHTIERIKGKDNLYKLNNSKFKSIGTNVPETIKQILNVDDINFQKQLDNPFLISSTSGEVAKYFNKIAGLNIIDLAQSNIQSEINSTNSLLKFKGDQLKKAEEKLSTFSYLEEAELQLTNLENLENEKRGLQNDFTTLGNLCIRILELEKKILKSWSTELEDVVDELLLLHSDKKEIHTKYKKLNSLLWLIQTKQASLERYANIESSEALITKLLRMLSGRTETLIKADKIENTIESIIYFKKSLKTQEKDILQLEHKLHDNITICPLCNTNLKK